MEVEAKDVGGGDGTNGRLIGGALPDSEAGVGVGVGGVILNLEGGGKGFVGKGGRGGGGGGGTGLSDEEEPSFDGDAGDGGGGQGGGKNKKSSPWQRMKWTDAMVKLLISVVLFIGEDNGLDGNEGNKRKSGILQKKGKWKSVSKVMMEKGCYVSPQQCEDKFNDLNKRYKRLNDILGKGTACNVVESPSLLDAMVTLPPKAKEDVRKILSSKHLFYKEMAFYHSGNKAALATDLEFQPSFQTAMIQSRDMMEGGRPIRDDMDDDDDDDDEGEEDDVDDEYDLADGIEDDGDAIGDAVGDLSDPFGKRRKLSKKLEEVELGMAASGLHDFGSKEISGVELVNTELMGVLQDSSKDSHEHQQWMRSRTMQLEEQKVGLQAEAFNLEKQRFKWQKLSWKKDHEIERMRLENERIKLENERKDDGDTIGDLSDPFGKRRKLSKKMEEVELGMAASDLHDYGSKEITGLELVNTELMGVLQDSSKVSREHQQWIKSRTMQLEEQKVGLQAEAFNLEKQRFKWQKLSWKTDHEIERMRLENDRIKLENERKALQLKQKELLLQFLRNG